MATVYLNIYSVDGTNVYIEERDNGYLMEIWVAPVNYDGSIDHTMWAGLEEDMWDEYLNSDKTKISKITLKRFLTILQKDYADWFIGWDDVIPKLNILHRVSFPELYKLK
jgi:hypothetical protein